MATAVVLCLNQGISYLHTIITPQKMRIKSNPLSADILYTAGKLLQLRGHPICKDTLCSLIPEAWPPCADCLAVIPRSPEVAPRNVKSIVKRKRTSMKKGTPQLTVQKPAKERKPVGRKRSLQLKKEMLKPFPLTSCCATMEPSEGLEPTFSPPPTSWNQPAEYGYMEKQVVERRGPSSPPTPRPTRKDLINGGVDIGTSQLSYSTTSTLPTDHGQEDSSRNGQIAIPLSESPKEDRRRSDQLSLSSQASIK